MVWSASEAQVMGCWTTTWRSVNTWSPGSEAFMKYSNTPVWSAKFGASLKGGFPVQKIKYIYQHQNIIFLLCTLVFRNFFWKYSPEFWLNLSNHSLQNWSFGSWKVILVLVLFLSRSQFLKTHEQSKLPSFLSSFQKLVHYSYELYHFHQEF